MNDLTNLDPDPEIWLSGERLVRLKEQVLPLSSCLQICGLRSAVLKAWLALELSAAAPWPLEERKSFAAARREAWQAKQPPDAPILSEDELLERLSFREAGRVWAHHQWQHKLESLFLKNKARLDRASCWLLRVTDRDLALELYHRIKAGEQTFKTLAREYSEGPERLKDGQFQLESLSKLPMGLGKVLERLAPGELTPPTPLGKRWALVQLEQWEPARFDETARRQLLDDELDHWLTQAVAVAVDRLKS